MQDGQPESANEVSFPNHVRIRVIEEGGRGDVWLACDAKGAYYAVKVIPRDRFTDENVYAWELYDAEKFQSVSLSHEGLIDILRVAPDELRGGFYYLMELGDDASGVKPGGASGDSINPDAYQPRTLRSEVVRRGALPLPECLAVALNLTSALNHLHQKGFIHPDTTSSNIIIVKGTAKLAKIARTVDSPNASSFGGTDGFVPPAGVGTVRGDIYSLGKAFYEMLTGNDARQFPQWPNFEDPAHRASRRHLKDIVLKMCAADPGKRYANCESVHADLLAVQSGRVGNRTRLIAAAIVVILGLAAGAFFWSKQNDSSPAIPPVQPPSVVETPRPPSPVQPAPQPVAQPAPAPPTSVISRPAPQLPSVVTTAAHVPAFRVGKTLFADPFDKDSSAAWKIYRTSEDTAAIFGYDYSEMGIPPAPSGNRKAALRLAANMALPKSRETVSLSPAGQEFKGNYRLKFHLWMNSIGPFPQGGVGSTQYFLAGVGTAGDRTRWHTNSSDDGIWFTTNGDGDGGSKSDFNAYRGGKQLPAADPGVYAAGTDDLSRGNTHPYYAAVFPGGQKPPAAQSARYPMQKGGMFVGCIGMAWRTVEIVKLDQQVYWSIDGLLIATVDVNSQPMHKNIVIGYADVVDTIAEKPELCFGLVANLTVEEIFPAAGE
jgi:serine/threonine protein kinase